METVEPTPADVVPLLKGTHTHTQSGTTWPTCYAADSDV